MKRIVLSLVLGIILVGCGRSTTTTPRYDIGGPNGPQAGTTLPPGDTYICSAETHAPPANGVTIKPC